MRKKIISLSIILILLITIPLFTVKNKIIDNANSEKNNIYYLVQKTSEKNYHTETLKALAVIIQTNIEYGKKYNIKKVKINDKVKKAVDSVYNIKIKINDKYIYIPYKHIVKKDTNKSKYTYLKNYANPYDMLTSQYNMCKNSQAISINTLNHLSKNGLSYKKSLNYFLCNITFTEK